MSLLFLWILENALAATLVALVVWPLAGALKSRPGLQHALWLVVLVKLATPGIVAWPWSLSGFGDEVLGSVAQEAPPEGAVGVDLDSIAVAQHFDPAVGEVDYQRQPLAASTTGSGEDVVGPRQMFLNVGINACVVAWLLGASLILAVQIRRISRKWMQISHGEAAPQSVTSVVESVSQRLSQKAVPAVVVPGIASPFVWYYGSVRLVWPRSLASTFDAARMKTVVAHELAHLIRRDHWVRWLMLITGVIYWWHPVYWIAAKKLRETAEVACDAIALSAFGDRRAYAELFLELTSGQRADTPAPVLGMGSGASQSFERRFRMMLDERIRGQVSPRGFLLVGIVLSLAVPTWPIAADETASQSEEAAASHGGFPPVTPPQNQPEKVIARVNGEPITARQFYQAHRQDHGDQGSGTQLSYSDPLHNYSNPKDLTRSGERNSISGGKQDRSRSSEEDPFNPDDETRSRDKEGLADFDHAAEDSLDSRSQDPLLISNALKKMELTVSVDDVIAEIKREADEAGVSVATFLDIVRKDRSMTINEYSQNVIWRRLALQELAGSSDFHAAPPSIRGRHAETAPARQPATDMLILDPSVTTLGVGGSGKASRTTTDMLAPDPSVTTPGGGGGKVSRGTTNHIEPKAIAPTPPGADSDLTTLGGGGKASRTTTDTLAPDPSVTTPGGGGGKVSRGTTNHIEPKAIAPTPPGTDSDLTTLGGGGDGKASRTTTDMLAPDPSVTTPGSGGGGKASRGTYPVSEATAGFGSSGVTRQKRDKDVLRGLINRKVITQALQSRGLTVSAGEVKSGIKREADEAGVSVSEFLKRILKERSMTIDEYTQDVIWPRLAMQKLTGRSDVDAGVRMLEQLRADAEIIVY